MREINTDQLINNYNEMINLLEYDSMRSAGKAKINCETVTNKKVILLKPLLLKRRRLTNGTEYRSYSRLYPNG